jgi:hypothetical protein
MNGTYTHVSAGQRHVCARTSLGDFDCGTPSWNAIVGPGPYDDVCVVGTPSVNGPQSATDTLFVRKGTGVWTNTSSTPMSYTGARFDCGPAYAAFIDSSNNVTYRR